jgi:RTX calcium-binding nonapeptide repeat (4 copies)
MRIRLVLAVALTVFAAGALAGPTTPAKRPTCLGVPATTVGTAKADVLRGTPKRDVVVALGGADRVYGRGGDDLLCGGPGDDLLDGGPGRNRLDGGAGRDRCLRGPRATGCESARPPAPPIAGVTLDGERLSLASFRGRAVFVNVWASW